MDLFIDKLAQKISSTEMIRANTAAEAKETIELKAKVEGYEKLLQEMKLINLKNIESAEKLSALASECTEAVRAAAEAGKDSDNEEENDALIEKTSDLIHKENVKVYRNIQAAVQSSIDDQTKVIVDAQVESSKKNSTTFIKVMSVLIFVAVLADIALKVLSIFGIL